MTYTNLNISDGTHQFKYILEYIDDNTASEEPIKYIQRDDNIFFNVILDAQYASNQPITLFDVTFKNLLGELVLKFRLNGAS